VDELKRKTIVREIEHWRRSRLLPEQYCDFLMNLYLEGSTDEKSGPWSPISTKKIRNSNWKTWLMAVSVFTFISLIVLNFNAFHIGLQMAVSALFVSLLYWLGLRLKGKSQTSSTLYYGIGTLTLLFLGEYILWLHGVSDELWIIGYLVLCSLFWVLFGSLTRTAIVHFCGWFGFMLFYGWLLQVSIDEISWISAQVYWMPWAVIFIWLGWLLHLKDKSLSIVFFVVGTILWFIPEAFCYIILDDSTDWLQGAFVIKLAVTAILLFSFRKKWTEWVAIQ
jgi:hypothetical protein